MKFGVSVASYSTTWDNIRASIETMEAGRWGSLWVPDHFIPPSAWKGAEDQPMHEAYGWEYPSLKERSDRFEEACALIRALFTSDSPVDFHGQYYNLDSAPLSPGSFQKPHIPIMVGGMGERRTLRTLAKYGDVWNLDGFSVGSENARSHGGMSLELYRHKIDVINQHCEDVGRDPGEIKYTVSMPTKLSNDEAEVAQFIEQVGPGTVAGNAEYIVDRVGEFIDAGVDEIMFSPRPSDSEAIQRLDEEVVAAFD